MRGLALSIVLGLAGCGAEAPGAPDGGAPSPEDATPGPDAAGLDATGSDAAAPSPELAIGTGLSRFEPLAEGATLDLVAGPQGGGRYGGHHVLVALRLVGVTPGELETLEVRLFDGSGAQVGFLARDPARTPFVADRELPNLQPRVEDCCVVAGEALRVEARAGRSGGGELVSTLEGVASACPNPSQGPSICP